MNFTMAAQVRKVFFLFGSVFNLVMKSFVYVFTAQMSRSSVFKHVAFFGYS